MPKKKRKPVRKPAAKSAVTPIISADLIASTIDAIAVVGPTKAVTQFVSTDAYRNSSALFRGVLAQHFAAAFRLWMAVQVDAVFQALAS